MKHVRRGMDPNLLRFNGFFCDIVDHAARGHNDNTLVPRRSVL